MAASRRRYSFYFSRVGGETNLYLLIDAIGVLPHIFSHATNLCVVIDNPWTRYEPDGISTPLTLEGGHTLQVLKHHGVLTPLWNHSGMSMILR